MKDHVWPLEVVGVLDLDVIHADSPQDAVEPGVGDLDANEVGNSYNSLGGGVDAGRATHVI